MHIADRKPKVKYIEMPGVQDRTRAGVDIEYHLCPSRMAAENVKKCVIKMQ